MTEPRQKEVQEIDIDDQMHERQDRDLENAIIYAEQSGY